MHFRMLTAACGHRPLQPLMGAFSRLRRAGCPHPAASTEPLSYVDGGLRAGRPTTPQATFPRTCGASSPKGTSVGRKRRPLQGLRNALGLIVGVDAHTPAKRSGASTLGVSTRLILGSLSLDGGPMWASAPTKFTRALGLIVGRDTLTPPPSIGELPYVDGGLSPKGTSVGRGQAALQHHRRSSLELAGRRERRPLHGLQNALGLIVGVDAHTPAKRSGASTLGVSTRVYWDASVC